MVAVATVVLGFIVFCGLATIWGLLTLSVAQCEFVPNPDKKALYIFLQLPMQCGETRLEWYIIPVIGTAMMVLVSICLAVLAKRFPNQIRQLAVLLRLNTLLTPVRVNTENYWRPLDLEGKCEICYDDNAVLGTMCAVEQHQLCEACSKRWVRECRREATCPYCRQASEAV